MKGIAYWALLMLSISLGACTYESLEAPDNCLAPFELEIVAVSTSSCGEASGQLEVQIVNPTPAQALATFSIDGENFKDNGLFQNLQAGVYSVQAKNGNCTASINVTIENEDGLNVSLSTSASSCGNASGQIQLAVSGAEGAVEYRLNGNPPQSSSVFENLAPGNYQISVRDASGCELSLETTILSDVSFSAVDAIIRSNCAVSGCHNGNVSPDLRDPSTIKDRAGRIQSRTNARSMPPASSGRSLSQAQIDAIQCWVDDGAPQ